MQSPMYTLTSNSTKMCKEYKLLPDQDSSSYANASGYLIAVILSFLISKRDR